MILVGRSAARLEHLREALSRHTEPTAFRVVVADLGSLGSVATAVDRILATEPRLDVLVDNAGAIHAARSESPDGIESTLALLVVGPFALEHGSNPSCARRRGRA